MYALDAYDGSFNSVILIMSKYMVSDHMYETNFVNRGTNRCLSFFSGALHRESLLHLAVRWGLPKLSQFLVCLPGGVQALALPNEEGSTPLDLALNGGHSKLVEDITK